MKHIFTARCFVGVAVAIISFSCSKHAGDVEEYIPTATISFASPTQGAVYHRSDSINLQATAISTETIHGYDLAVKKASDTTVYYFLHVHDHNDTLVINQRWKPNGTEPTDLDAEITLYLDHEGHTAIKKTRFKIQ